MIQDAMTYQRNQIADLVESHTANLVRGTPSRDEDQRIRGIIYGLKLAEGIVIDTEDKLRAAERADD